MIAYFFGDFCRLMRTLIAVTTCHRFAERAQAQRDTWVPYAIRFSDVRFFVGRMHNPTVSGHADGGELMRRTIGSPAPALASNTVVLDVDDSYEALPQKVKAVMSYSVTQGYDYVWKLDDDVYLVPGALERAALAHNRYVGNVRAARGGYPSAYPSGFCYGLCGEAARIIAEAPLSEDESEDRWVGNILAKHGIMATHESRFICTYPGLEPSGQMWLSGVRNHIAFAQYDAAQIRALHYWRLRVLGEKGL